MSMGWARMVFFLAAIVYTTNLSPASERVTRTSPTIRSHQFHDLTGRNVEDGDGDKLGALKISCWICTRGVSNTRSWPGLAKARLA